MTAVIDLLISLTARKQMFFPECQTIILIQNAVIFFLPSIRVIAEQLEESDDTNTISYTIKFVWTFNRNAAPHLVQLKSPCDLLFLQNQN